MYCVILETMSSGLYAEGFRYYRWLFSKGVTTTQPIALSRVALNGYTYAQPTIASTATLLTLQIEIKGWSKNAGTLASSTNPWSIGVDNYMFPEMFTNGTQCFNLPIAKPFLWSMLFLPQTIRMYVNGNWIATLDEPALNGKPFLQNTWTLATQYAYDVNVGEVACYDNVSYGDITRINANACASYGLPYEYGLPLSMAFPNALTVSYDARITNRVFPFLERSSAIRDGITVARWSNNATSIYRSSIELLQTDPNLRGTWSATALSGKPAIVFPKGAYMTETPIQAGQEQETVQYDTILLVAKIVSYTAGSGVQLFFTTDTTYGAGAAMDICIANVVGNVAQLVRNGGEVSTPIGYVRLNTPFVLGITCLPATLGKRSLSVVAGSGAVDMDGLSTPMDAVVVPAHSAGTNRTLQFIRLNCESDRISTVRSANVAFGLIQRWKRPMGSTELLQKVQETRIDWGV